MATRRKKKVDVVEDDGTSVGEALEAAAACEAVLVIGVGSDGSVALHSSMPYAPDNLWAIELARAQVLEMANHYSD